jgi:hypothetical protein
VPRAENLVRFAALGTDSRKISRLLAHEGGKVVCATHRPPLSSLPGIILGTHLC